MSEPVNWENLPEFKPPQIPDHVPSVSFDIQLGKKYSDVNFDYELFAEKVTQMGISPSEAAGISITFLRQGISDIRASHSANEHHIDVGVALPSKVNKKLVHELQHEADFLSGNIQAFGPRANYRYALHSRLVKPLIGLTAIDYYRNFLSKIGNLKPFDYMTDLSVPRVALLGTAATFLWSYSYHPRERRAKKAGRKNSSEIASFTK